MPLVCERMLMRRTHVGVIYWRYQLERESPINTRRPKMFV
jgi:hypothetical protein